MDRKQNMKLFKIENLHWYEPVKARFEKLKSNKKIVCGINLKSAFLKICKHQYHSVCLVNVNLNWVFSFG